MPASRDGLGPFYQDVIAVSPLEPWDAASAAYRLEILAHALPFPVGGARLVPSNNNDVWRLETGYLRVAWRGDRSRLAREAELLGRLRGFLPVPEVLDCGGDDRLSVPADLADLLRYPGEDLDPLRRSGSELVLMPPSAVLGLIPLAGQLPFVDHGVLNAAAERLAELGDPMTADGEVLLHGDFYLGNVLVRGDHVTALIDLEFARMGPRDLELISVVRALDAETRLGIRRPPLLAWLAEDYPELFGAANLRGRLWSYALAYTIRQIIFWPPDRAEADDLEITHPLHTLRRLIDAPLPLPAAGLSEKPLTTGAPGWNARRK